MIITGFVGSESVLYCKILGYVGYTSSAKYIYNLWKPALLLGLGR